MTMHQDTPEKPLSNHADNDSLIVIQSTLIEVMWCITGGTTILTNLGILLIIGWYRKLRQTPHAPYMISMFIGSLLSSIFYVLPRHIKAGNNHMMQYPFPCSIMPYLGSSFLVNLNFHICILTLNRYLSIEFPFRNLYFLSHKVSVCILICLWLLTAAIAALPLMTFVQYNSSRCAVYIIAENEDARVSQQVYLTIIFTCLLILPLASFLPCYARIFYIVNVHARRMQGENDGHGHQLSLNRHNIKAARQIIILVTLFLICYLPFAITFMILNVRPGLIYTTTELNIIHLLRFVAFSYPAVNPILFAFYTADIKIAIKMSLSNLSNQCCKRFRHHSYQLST
ncbi:uncharacterized protein TRIADDRAFT_53973 [Trichoplax adhaerens]|uniref:G-protein coupled receptors family 1 profile domain-containing protein n=1 Tax=Trichoplax adhaerens TaxID=10228 RepID=B3RMJ8_TRIAD|nr:hypothetical protein TRIADDRAFT_53973 [Trichoplax adhaerens]EDV28374.1 hypothetical protein TRIADDRAFT_53973 [Trichoplax adhaerens]|eukprot:XP_002110208.1 hypothetical protein TRIADDRAFT_53973 [Trichoplax adhaerens]